MTRELTRIYVASKSKHGAMWRTYRERGYPICSTWIDENEAGQTEDWGALWRRCLSEAATCDVLILYANDGESLVGAFVETGAALGTGRPVLYVGPEDIARNLLRHPSVRRIDSLDEAFAAACLVDGVAAQGAGEAVAWQLFDRDGNDCAVRPEVQQRVAEMKCQEFNATPELSHKAPYTVRPLYARPAVAPPSQAIDDIGVDDGEIDGFARTVLAPSFDFDDRCRECEAVKHDTVTIDGEPLCWPCYASRCEAYIARLKQSPAVAPTRASVEATSAEPWPEVTQDMVADLQSALLEKSDVVGVWRDNAARLLALLGPAGVPANGAGETTRDALLRLIAEASRNSWEPYDVLGFIARWTDREFPAPTEAT